MALSYPDWSAARVNYVTGKKTFTYIFNLSADAHFSALGSAAPAASCVSLRHSHSIGP